MRIGSLFSGIGGLEKGLEQSGIGHTVWQVENNARLHPCLATHWPNAKRYHDVREIHSTAYLDDAVRTYYDGDMVGKLRKLTAEQAEECVRMYQAGMSLAPIADYFGVSRQAMWDMLRRRIKLRPQARHGNSNHFYRGGSTEDDHAQNMVEVAIRQGVLVRKSACEECGDTGTFKDGRTRIQAHHCDYNAPLSVMWLCQKCHHKWHKHNKSKRKEVLGELAPVDIICGGFP